MPTDMSKYPDNWEEIRAKILRRAGGRDPDPRVGARCELCGVLNYAVGYRNETGKFYYEDGDDTGDIEVHLYASYSSARERVSFYNWNNCEKHIVIVLTIAHIDNPDPMDCRPGNLKALCQKCHNDHDSEMRARNRKVSARQKEIERGQLTLPI